MKTTVGGRCEVCGEEVKGKRYMIYNPSDLRPLELCEHHYREALVRIFGEAGLKKGGGR